MNDSCCSSLNISQIDAELAGFLLANSELVYREIFMIQSKILDYVNSCIPCKTNCILIDNDTPFTFYPYIKEINVLEGGQNYFPSTTIASIMTSSGYDAELEVITENGIIVDVNVINGGTGYSALDTIIVSHPTGQGAVLSASFALGEVTDVTVIEGGENYYPINPLVELTYTGDGYGAIATPIIDPLSGTITGVSITDGGMFYASETSASIINAVDQVGDGAYLSVVVNDIPLDGVDNSVYYDYVASDIDACYAKDHIGAVLTFFRNRGFKISAEVNEKTLSTIAWKICWC